MTHGIGAIASSYAREPDAPFLASDYGTVWGEWDASDETTLTATDGAVTAWADKSGNGRHATQSTEGDEPTTGVETIGGLNALVFDGANSWIRLANADIAQPFIIATVAASSSIANAQRRIISGPANRYIGKTSTTQATLHYGTQLSANDAMDTAPHLWVGITDGSSSSLRKDGSEVAAGAAGANSLAGGQFMAIGAGIDGATAPWLGTIGHVIVYTAVTNLAGLESALINKWGI